MHSEIDPECWCVTRRDLRELRRRVRLAVLERRIVPTEMDNFDPAENEVGPNFYTVVEQYLKLETAETRASWALERHPGGLACDLFVTHAWAEGVYEFIDKVLGSWPWSARHAWICTLSMPQHLDISGLISSPSKSPFAKALERATDILVVPNRRSSIYTRLWCVYEAFLAQQQGKTLRTAVRTDRRGMAASVGAVFGMCGVGILWGWVASPDEATHDRLNAAVWFCLASSLLVGGAQVTRAIHWTGAVLAGYNLMHPDIHKLHDIAYLVAAEIDGVRLAAYKEAAASLTHQLKGSVTSAKCSEYADEVAIWLEIGSDARRVDDAIDVLIRAKQSTPLWTHLTEAGCSVRDVGFTRWALPVFILVSLMVHSYVVATVHPTEIYQHLPVLIVQGLWVINLHCLHIDRRAFSVLMLEKCMMLYFLLHCIQEIIGDGKIEREARYAFESAVTGSALLLSAVSPLVLLHVPVLGRCIVKCTLRHVRFHIRFALPRCRKRTAGTRNHIIEAPV